MSVIAYISFRGDDSIDNNTDSVRGAVDNDMFGTLPDLSMLTALDRGWPDER